MENETQQELFKKSVDLMNKLIEKKALILQLCDELEKMQEDYNELNIKILSKK